MIKTLIKQYLPYKYVNARCEKQHIEILKEQIEPEVFNKTGVKKRVFYLEDTLCQHTPYTLVLGQIPELLLWDRNNMGLPIHFYSHEKIFNYKDSYAKKKFALLFESESIKEDDYKRALSEKEILRSYDRIFTFSERMLNMYDNAMFIPASGLWVGTDINGGNVDATINEKKEKMISVIASNKTSSKYHKIRVELAKKAVKTGLVDGYGMFCDRYIEHKADALVPYRYSIVVENDVNSYYFTEKILDCFASMTVPIYVGATKINDFFNGDGIINITNSDYNYIDEIIKKCSVDDYNCRLNAIRDNFERVKEYRCIEDYIMQKYSKDFII